MYFKSTFVCTAVVIVILIASGNLAWAGSKYNSLLVVIAARAIMNDHWSAKVNHL